jgi:hypothetical protein
MIHPLNAASNTHFFVSVSKAREETFGVTAPLIAVTSFSPQEEWESWINLRENGGEGAEKSRGVHQEYVRTSLFGNGSKPWRWRFRFYAFLIKGSGFSQSLFLTI